MTTEQLEQANSIQQQIDYVTGLICQYLAEQQHQIEKLRRIELGGGYINKRIEKEQSDMKVEVSLPCNNGTLDIVDKLIQILNW